MNVTQKVNKVHLNNVLALKFFVLCCVLYILHDFTYCVHFLYTVLLLLNNIIFMHK